MNTATPRPPGRVTAAPIAAIALAVLLLPPRSPASEVSPGALVRFAPTTLVQLGDYETTNNRCVDHARAGNFASAVRSCAKAQQILVRSLQAFLPWIRITSTDKQTLAHAAHNLRVVRKLRAEAKTRT
jgi:hypothetical protein